MRHETSPEQEQRLGRRASFEPISADKTLRTCVYNRYARLKRLLMTGAGCDLIASGLAMDSMPRRDYLVFNQKRSRNDIP